MLGKCPEKQMTVTLKFAQYSLQVIIFPVRKQKLILEKVRQLTVVLKMDVKASCARLNLRKRSKSFLENRHGTQLGSYRK